MSKWVFRKEKYCKNGGIFQGQIWVDEMDGREIDFAESVKRDFRMFEGHLIYRQWCEKIKEGAEMSDGCKWCDRQGDWRVDCVFWGPGNTSVKSYTQEMKAQVKYCPVCGKSIKPRLTAEQVEVLKALLLFDMNWLCKENIGGVFAYNAKPFKRGNGWHGGRDTVAVYPREKLRPVSSLVSWADPEPLDIVQTLRDNGVDA